MKDSISFEFSDIRCGTIVGCALNEKARKPAYILDIDFGQPLGIKRSSAQITALYTCESLIGTQVLALVDIAPKKVASIISEVLVLGFQTSESEVVLVRPEQFVTPGTRLS